MSNDASSRRRGRIDALIGLVLLLVVVLALADPYERLLTYPDIGTQLAKGQQIRLGYHPFVDIDNATYGPGIFYSSGILQRLTPDNRVWPELLWIALAQSVSFGILLWVMRSHLERRWLYFAYVTSQVLAFPIVHKYFTVLPVALTALVAHRTARAGNGRPGLVAGVATGVALLFRLDLGLAVAASSALALILRRHEPLRLRGRRMVAASLSAGVVLLPWLVFLLVNTDLVEVAAQTFHSSRGVSSGLSKAPPGFDPTHSWTGSPENLKAVLFWFSVALPLFALGTVLVELHRSSDSDTPAGSRAHVLAVVTLYSLLSMVPALYRADVPHMKQSLVAGLFVGFLGLDSWRGSREPGVASRLTGGLRLAVLAALLIVVQGTTSLTVSRLSPSHLAAKLVSWGAPLESELLRIASSSPDAPGSPSRGTRQLALTLREVRELTRPDEPVLFLPFFPQAYFFSERGFETPVGWITPGRFGRRGSVDRFLTRLQSTRIIVDLPAQDFGGRLRRVASSPEGSVFASIYRDYRIREVLPPYLLLERAAPSTAGPPSPFSFAAWDAPAATTLSPTDSCRRAGWRVTHVNTLPTGSGTIDLPVGGPVLLRLEQCDEELAPPCRPVSLVLRSSEASYRLSDERRGEGAPASLRRIGQWIPIDTSRLPPARYGVQFHRPDSCPDGGVLVEGGLTLQLVEPPGSPPAADRALRSDDGPGSSSTESRTDSRTPAP